VPIRYWALTQAVLPSLNFPDNRWFCSNTVHVINLCPESTAQRRECSGCMCGADQCEGISAILLKFNQLGYKFCCFDGQKDPKKGKGKAPPKPPSGNRDDEEVAEIQNSKSMKLAESSPPPNSVLTHDNLSVAIVASGDV
jgi:hypothetical protein